MPAVNDILTRLGTEVIQPAVQVIFAAGFLFFMWGLVKFLWNLSEGGENDEGKQHMIWGILGMVIMISIWSIIALLTNTLGLGNPRDLQNGPAADPNRNQIQVVRFNQ